MERFAMQLTDSRQREELLDALHGRGAFRMFKSTARRLGVEEQWHRFRDAAFDEIASEWLKSNGIEYD
jgi:hypothetical protein